MELLFILNKPLVCLQNCKAVKIDQTTQNRKCQNFWKYKIFVERLKDSTQGKHNCVKTFDVRHDAKGYRASQGITDSWKMQLFRNISFLNDLKFYDEERNKLS